MSETPAINQPDRLTQPTDPAERERLLVEAARAPKVPHAEVDAWLADLEAGKYRPRPRARR